MCVYEGQRGGGGGYSVCVCKEYSIYILSLRFYEYILFIIMLTLLVRYLAKEMTAIGGVVGGIM